MSITRSSPVQVAAFSTTFSQAPKLVSTSWSKISVGPSHVLAIKSNNTLWSWGINTNGQIGDGTTISRSSPVQLGNPGYTWNEAVTGINYSVAVRGDGLLFAWGLNSSGVLGNLNAGTTARSSPIQIGTSSWVAVSAGGTHVIAIRSDKSLWGWGLNTSGQLGTGDYFTRSSPVQISTSSWASVSAGQTHTTAITSNGKLFTWGDNTVGTLGYTTPTQSYFSWTVVSSETDNTIAIRNDGLLFAWGSNQAGQLGLGDTAYRSSPVQVGSNSWIALASTWTATPGFTMAIRSDGTLWGWGLNTAGQLGDGTIISRSSPVQVSGGGSWSNVAISNYHALAIKTDGTLYAWGTGTSGQLGDGLISRSSPVKVGTSSWTKISAGDLSSYAIKLDGTLYAWGIGTDGRLGLGDTLIRSSPVQIGSGSWINVYAHASPTFVHAIDINNKLFGWGVGTSGQLGYNDLISRSSPIQISSGNWSSVSTYGFNSLGLQTDGSLWSWGTKAIALMYEFGNASFTYSWSQVSAGPSHTAAIRSDGRLYTWGFNSVGQLGNSSTANTSSPVFITVTTGNAGEYWNRVSVNGLRTVGILSDGTLWAWGSNAGYLLGDGTSVNRSSPFQIGATFTSSAFTFNGSNQYLSSASNVAVDLSTSDFTVECWVYLDGSNNSRGFFAAGNSSRSGIGYQISTSGILQFIYGDGTTVTFATGTNALLLNRWIHVATSRVGSNARVYINGVLEITVTSSNFGAGSYSCFVGIGYGISAGNLTLGSPILGYMSNIRILKGVALYTSNFSVPTSPLTLVSGSTSLLLTSATTDDSGTLTITNNGGVGVVTNFAPFFVSPFFTQISAGLSHTIAVSSLGRMYAWGDNTYTQLGYTNANSYSTLFSGSSYITIASNALFTIGTSDFTFEVWIYPTSYPATQATIFGNWGNTNTWQIWMNPTGKVFWQLWTSDNNNAGNTATVSLNVWTHVAWTRTGGNCYTFFNGVLVTTNANSFNASGSGATNIGGQGASLYFTGSMSNMRFIKGTGLYSASFTPSTTPLTSVTNTSLLALQNTTLIDNSGNNLTLTATGTVTAGQTLNPFGRYPTQIGSSSWSAVSSYGTHNLAIDTNNKLYAWGDNTLGQIGVNYSPLLWTVVDSFHTTHIIRNDGTAYGTGWNSGGPIGDNSTVKRSSLVQIAGSWVQIVSGQFDPTNNNNGYSIGIKSDGTLYTWGSNLNGILGDITLSTTVSRSSPVQIGTSSWISVSTAENTVVAIRSDYTLWAWGKNDQGQLGDSTSINRSSPVQIGTSSWSQISVGRSSAMALRIDGTLWVWGRGTEWQLAPQNGINNSRSSPVQVGGGASYIQVSGKSYSKYAIRSDYTLWGWGYNINGELGLNDLTSRSSPVQINAEYKFDSVESGFDHVIAKRRDGTIWGWGLNDFGQLGQNNPNIYRSSPVQIGTSSWVSISAGYKTTFGITVSGINGLQNLYAWGRNWDGELGDGTTNLRSSPVQIGSSLQVQYVSSPTQIGTSSWTSISAGLSNSFAIRSDYKLFSWGDNSQLQSGYITPATILGTGSNPNNNAQSYIRSTDNALIIWGLNTSGEIGDGTTINRSSPVQLGLGLGYSQFAKIARAKLANLVYTLGVKTDGTLWSWGSNTGGQLGIGLTTSRSSPVQVGTLSNWSDVAAGPSHALAIKSDGSLWGWGINTNGQIGDNTTVNRSSPVQIGTSSWTAVSAGSNFSTAIRTDGGLFTWGFGTQGQLGSGLTTARSNPVQVGTESYTSISSGGSHSVALRTDLTLYAWGLNNAGQLGDTSTINRSSPVQVNTGLITSWNFISAGASHTSAIDATNNLPYGWGLNSSGQIGDSTLVSRSAPVQVISPLANNNYSYSFNGSTQHLTLGGQSNFNFGTGNFTIELWVYLNAYASNASQIYDTRPSGTVSVSGYQNMQITSTGQLIFGGTAATGGTTNVSLNTWSHIAVARQGTTTKLFLNGIQVGINSSDTSVYGVGASRPIIGTDGNNPLVSGYSFNGYISNLRVIKGTALYTTGFYPSAGALSTSSQGATLSQVSLLTAQSATIVDNSTNAFTITNTGTVAASSNQPFGPYYSASFNGTNQYLSLADNTAMSQWWTQDYTIELWVYNLQNKVSGVNSAPLQVVYGVPTSNTTNWAFGTNASGNLRFYYYNGAVITNAVSTSTVSLNTWTHIAMVYTNANTTITGYINGVQAFSVAKSGTPSSTASTINIGVAQNTYYNGYISNLRIVNGTAVYTGNFTVPTNILRTTQSAMTNIVALTGTETSLLTLQSATIVDNSVNAFTFTNNNSVSATTAYAPFIVTGASLTWDSVIAGVTSTMGTSNNTLFTWGAGTNGQLGDSTTVTKSAPTATGAGSIWSVQEKLFSSPVQVGTAKSWSIITTGGSHAIAIATDNSLWSWGVNNIGQFGDNTTVSKSSPTQIAGNTSSYTFITAGVSDTFAIRTTTALLFAWGINTAGQLGDASTVAGRSSPVQVFTGTMTSPLIPIKLNTVSGSSYTQVAAGSAYNIIDNAGRLFTWGTNLNGQIGNNTTVSRSSPIQLGGIQFTYINSPVQVGTSSYSQVSAGSSHTLAIDSNSLLYAWGKTPANGDTVTRSSPMQIGANSWLNVSTGNDLSLATDITKTLYAWGLNTNYQLGSPNFYLNQSVTSPVAIGTLAVVQSETTSGGAGNGGFIKNI